MALGALSPVRRRLFTTIAATIALSGCGFLPSVGYRNPANLHDAPVVPKKLPRSPYGNAPYTVDGHTYYPLKSAKGYVARGIASWYGRPFNGQRTSDGSVYNMYAMTAANKVLPLPCYALVRNLHNGRSVVVLINDRGPFYPHRIIDLSYAAAAKLGVLATGTAPVEVVGIAPGQSPLFGHAWDATSKQHKGIFGHHKRVFARPKPITTVAQQPKSAAVMPKKTAAPATQAGAYVQFGAFITRAIARKDARRLREAGLSHIVVVAQRVKGQRLYLVRQAATGLAQAREMSAYATHIGLGSTFIVKH